MSRAAPSLALGVLVPTACFLVGRHLWGLNGAVGLTLGWAAVCQGFHRLEGRRVSGLLLVSLVELVVRGSLALVFGSAEVYFIVSIVFTALSALIYVGCPPVSSRLIAWVISDVLPDSVIDVTDPRLAPFLRRISVAYGIEQLVVAVISLVMVLNLSVTAYVSFHVAVSWAVLALAAAVCVPFLRREARAVVSWNEPSIASL